MSVSKQASPPDDPLRAQQLAALLSGSRLQGLEVFAGHEFLRSLNHGRLDEWLQLLASVPPCRPSSNDFLNQVRIGVEVDCAPDTRAVLEQQLKSLIPWRKGPFDLFGISIDTEWRSDWKWERLRDHISDLGGRRVLDVGCGSGYHCFRMHGAGASLVLGVEPHLPYVMQFALLSRFVADLPVYLLPTTLERIPAELGAFDTVFSMGVLYHRRSPIDHLMELRGSLRKGGELVLETLIVDGPEGHALTPAARYCRMTNVWFIPSCDTTISWLRRCGFDRIRVVDVGPTTAAEQRATEWMPFQSLADGLDPDDSSRTIEGHPGPQRAIIVAERR